MTEAPFGAIAGLMTTVAMIIFAVTEMRTSAPSRLRNDWLIVVAVIAVVGTVLRIVQLMGR